MANMSYVRFENTCSDLYDCFKHINDRDLSISEKRSRAELINLCNDIIEEFEDDEFDDNIELED